MHPPKQPTCLSCRSPELRIEDVTTGRAQCGRCRHRCVIAPDGSTRDWLKIGRPTRRRYSRNYPKTAKTPCKANLTRSLVRS